MQASHVFSFWEILLANIVAVQHRYFMYLLSTITKTGYFAPGHRTHYFLHFLGSEEREWGNVAFALFFNLQLLTEYLP